MGFFDFFKSTPPPERAKPITPEKAETPSSRPPAKKQGSPFREPGAIPLSADERDRIRQEQEDRVREEQNKIIRREKERLRLEQEGRDIIIWREKEKLRLEQEKRDEIVRKENERLRLEQEERDLRKLKEDASIVFECQPDEIAWKKEDVNENTKAYVGPLFPGIFKQLGHLEHIYTTFPEGKITRQTIEIGGQTIKQLESVLEKAGTSISGYARQMLKQIVTGKKPEQADLVRLKVSDLFGDDRVHTTEEIFQRRDELGLDFCPAEVGPQYRLQYKDQPMDEWVEVGMKQFTGPVGVPAVFSVGRIAIGAWLNDSHAKPAYEWSPRSQWVFRLPARGGRSASNP